MLGKDSLEGAITMESFEKSLALLQASNSTKCNIISNLSIPIHSSIPKVCTQNISSIKNDLEISKVILLKHET